MVKQTKQAKQSKSPEELASSMVANLEDKTGKSFAEWCRLAKASGKGKHGEIVKHLKAEHGLTHGYANLVAAEVLKGPGGEPSGDDLVAAQYAGKKATLRPIHDALVSAARALGDDVEIAPKKTCVSLRRTRQFALIQPSTATRVDVGLRLDGVPAKGRLEPSGSFSAMVSHRVRVGAVGEIDAELTRWLRQAYEQA